MATNQTILNKNPLLHLCLLAIFLVIKISAIYLNAIQINSMCFSYDELCPTTYEIILILFNIILPLLYAFILAIFLHFISLYEL